MSNDDNQQPRFQFVRQLGGGVLGEVHEVVDEVSGESLRLKIFLRCRPLNLDSFRMEFEALSRLKQKNLAKMIRLIDPASDTNIVLEAKVGTPNLAFTQELVPGMPLLAYLAQPESEAERTILSGMQNERTDLLTPHTHDIDTPLSSEISVDDLSQPSSELHEVFRKSSELADASSIISELAQDKDAAPLDVVLLRLQKTIPGIVSGLEYLHRFQKNHGNLRSNNIIVSKDGEVKLTDYGIVASLVVNHENAKQTPLLQAPEYLPFTAPEIKMNEVSPASDLYALGCVLFEAIAGVSPFDVLEFDLNEGKRRLQTPPLSDYVPACPASWGELVDGLLRPNPDERTKLDEILPLIAGKATYTVNIQTESVERVPHFKGRKEELNAIIKSAKLATERNRLQLKIIKGQTGVGKSALLQESSHYLSRRGWLVLRSSCLHWESEIYHGWATIAQTLSMVLDSFPVDLSEQFFRARARATHMLANLRGDTELDGEAITRNMCVVALHELLKFVASEKPLLLVFDDIENASRDTSSLLVDLLCIPESFRSLVLITLNSEAQEPLLLDELSQTLYEYETLELEPMKRGDQQVDFLTPLGPSFNGLDFPLVTKWWLSFPQAVEDALGNGEIVDGRTLALATTRAVYRELKPIEQLITTLICASSARLSKQTISKIICEESRKYSDTQVEEGLEALLDLDFLREVGGDLELCHDTIRVISLEESEEKRITSLYKKLARTFANSVSRSSEYAHRAGAKRHSISKSVGRALNASQSFAYHRSASIWKWIGRNEETMPGSKEKDVDHLHQWADAEYLAQDYLVAADLYSKVVDRGCDDDMSVFFRQCESFLWSKNYPMAKASLVRSVKHLGGRVSPKTFDFSLPSSLALDRIGNIDSPPSDLSIAYQFASLYAPFLGTSLGKVSASKLAQNVKNEGIRSWKFAISAKIRHQYWDRLSTPSETFSAWTRDYGKQTDKDRNYFLLQKIRLRFGKHTLEFLKETFALMNPLDSVDVLIDALSFCSESLLFGAREQATKFALDVIRANHRNRFLSSIAYLVLIRDAINRHDIEGANLYFELADFCANFEGMSDFDLENFICESDLSVLKGECEVAVARYRLLRQSKAYIMLSERSQANFTLGMFRSLVSRYHRLTVFKSKRNIDTIREMAGLVGPLKKISVCGDPFLAAAAARSLALNALLNKKERRADRFMQQSIDYIDGRLCPLVNAISLEASSMTNDCELPEKKGMFQSSFSLQESFGYSHLLQDEGWPAFEDIIKN